MVKNKTQSRRNVRYRVGAKGHAMPVLVKVCGRRPSQVEREGPRGRRTETSQARTRGGTGLTLWGFKNSDGALQESR